MSAPRPSLRLIPLNFFGIPFGLLGLADCWLVGAAFHLAPVAVGRILVAVAAAVWVIVLTAHLSGARANGVQLTKELADPIAGPFASLAVITPTLAAADALYPLAHTAGKVIVDLGVLGIVILASWFTGQWIYGPLELAKVHPGYFLPSVAGGLVASASAGLVGQIGLAKVLFSLGLVSWIVLGSIVLGRLFIGPALRGPLTPTIAIEVAPAAVATFAWFVIDGHRVDTTVRLLAGYGVLMILAQLRLLPAYLRLRFLPSTWAFTFAWAAVAFAGLFWLGVTHPSGWKVYAYLVLAAISAFIGGIGLRTLVAMRRGQFVPTPAPAAHAEASAPAAEAPAAEAAKAEPPTTRKATAP